MVYTQVMAQHKKTESTAIVIDVDELPILSPAESDFVLYLQSRNCTLVEAYRATQDCTKLQDSTIYSNASRLASNSRVAAHRRAMTAVGLVASTYTREKFIEDCLSAAERCEGAGNYGAAYQNRAGAAKASGIVDTDQGERAPQFGTLAALLGAVASNQEAEVGRELLKEYGLVTDEPTTKH